MELNLKHLNGAFVNCPFNKHSTGIYLTTRKEIKADSGELVSRQPQMPANCTSFSPIN